jgi:hypothetical protein
MKNEETNRRTKTKEKINETSEHTITLQRFYCSLKMCESTKFLFSEHKDTSEYCQYEFWLPKGSKY